MSGSDPTVRRKADTGGGGDDACRYRFTTVLGSPVPSVVEDLNLNELLDIIKIDDPIRGVVAQTLDGMLVGAVTRDIAALRRCIEQGVLYEAEVLEIRGGSVTVEVRNQ
jgi:hypothetical protein